MEVTPSLGVKDLPEYRPDCVHAQADRTEDGSPILYQMDSSVCENRAFCL